MSARLREHIPTALLLLALAALIPFGGDRGYFYRNEIHNLNSSKTMALAENLSPAHRFRLFHKVWLNEDGVPRYSLYSRFPLGGPLLVKTASFWFGDDLSAKLLAARALALAMYAAAALFAYLAIARLAGSRWVALAASLIAFSGYYALYHSDGISSEITMDLFACMMAFHGMVVFVQEGAFRQFVLKTCAALLLGWHVYALLLPFIALGLGGDAIARLRPFLKRARVRQSREKPRLLAAPLSLVRSRYVALGAIAILFGAASLAFNFANDYAAYRGELALTELPLARAMLNRFGADEDFNADIANYADLRALPHFISRQLYRIGAQTPPYALSRLWEDGFEFPEPSRLSLPRAPIAAGILAMGLALGGLALARVQGTSANPLRRYGIPLAALTLFGLCWSLALRGNTLFPSHDHEPVFYAGVPMALVAIALIGARGAIGEVNAERLAIASGAAAAALFVLSAFHMAKVDRDEATAEFEYALMSELGAMRETARGKTVMIADDVNSSLPGAHFMATNYYFSGSYVVRPKDTPREVDFVVSRYRDDAFDPLTPGNSLAFLYEGVDVLDLYRAERRRLLSSEPAAEGDWSVYADGATLRYLKERCDDFDTETRFFVHVFPTDPDNLPPNRRREGFYGVNPLFYFTGKAFDGACIMLIDLPRYPISRIETGQYISGEGNIWSVSIRPTPDAETLAAYEAMYRSISSSQPAARADWDVYLDGKTLTYLKEPCAEEDARGRFLLSVRPARLSDVPEDRREKGGHESLNFDFDRWGVTFGGKCMVRRALPDYKVDSVEAGQWIPGGERLWSVEVEVGE